jgi:hypothetical protein
MSNAIKIGIAAGAAIVLILGVAAYIREREDRARFEQTIADQKNVIEESKKAMAANQVQLAETIAQWEKLRGTNQTPQQAVKIIREYAGVTPTIVMPAATAENPTPAPVLQLPIDQAQPWADSTITCKECEDKVISGEVDRRELVRQMQAVEAERNAAVRTVKGGTFFERFKRNGKWFLLGAAVGAGAVAATR